MASTTRLPTGQASPEKSGEVEEVTQALEEATQGVEHWKAQGLLTGRPAGQTHNLLEQIKQENKKLETAVETLQEKKRPSPVARQTSGAFPAPGGWGQKWKRVVLAILKDGTWDNGKGGCTGRVWNE